MLDDPTQAPSQKYGAGQGNFGGERGMESKGERVVHPSNLPPVPAPRMREGGLRGQRRDVALMLPHPESQVRRRPKRGRNTRAFASEAMADCCAVGWLHSLDWSRTQTDTAYTQVGQHLSVRPSLCLREEARSVQVHYALIKLFAVPRGLFVSSVKAATLWSGTGITERCHVRDVRFFLG